MKSSAALRNRLDALKKAVPSEPASKEPLGAKPGEGGESQDSEPPVPVQSGDALPEEPQDDHQVQAAVGILQQLLERLDVKHSQEAESQTAEDDIKYDQMGAKPILDPNEPIYVSLDGDNIGNLVAQAEEHDNEDALKQVSRRIEAGQSVLRQWTMEQGGTVIESGGDEGLVKVPGRSLQYINQLRKRYLDAVHATATVGVGMKISESTKARMLGKLRGKNVTVVWTGDEMDRELKLRVEQGKDNAEERVKVLTQIGGEDQPQDRQPEGAVAREPVPEHPVAPETGSAKAPPKWSHPDDGQHSKDMEDSAQWEKQLADEEKDRAEGEADNEWQDDEPEVKPEDVDPRIQESARESGQDPVFMHHVMERLK